MKHGFVLNHRHNHNTVAISCARRFCICYSYKNLDASMVITYTKKLKKHRTSMHRKLQFQGFVASGYKSPIAYYFTGKFILLSASSQLPSVVTVKVTPFDNEV